MAAASISLAFSHSSLLSLVSISPLRLPPSIPSDKPVLVLRTPSSRSPAASMSVEAPKKYPDPCYWIRSSPAYSISSNTRASVDNRDSLEARVAPEQAVKLCDRNFGTGADGVIFAMPAINGTDYSMGIFNSDGSEPEIICSLGEYLCV